MRVCHLRSLQWASLIRPSWAQARTTGFNELLFRRHVPIREAQASRRAHMPIQSFSSTRCAPFMLDADSTIYALSTAPGRAAIAVVRVSGPACASVKLPTTIKPHNPMLTRYANRSTKHSVLNPPSQNHASPRFEPSTTLTIHPPQKPCSTPALSSFTSPPRKQSQVKTCWSYIFTVVLL